MTEEDAEREQLEARLDGIDARIVYIDHQLHEQRAVAEDLRAEARVKLAFWSVVGGMVGAAIIGFVLAVASGGIGA